MSRRSIVFLKRLDEVLEERRLNTVTKKIRDPRPYLREEKRDIAKFGFSDELIKASQKDSTIILSDF